MCWILYHPIGSTVWEDKGAFLGSTHSVFVSAGYAGMHLECREAIDSFDIVLVGRALFDLGEPIGILRDKANGGICLGEVDFSWHDISRRVRSTHQ